MSVNVELSYLLIKWFFFFFHQTWAMVQKQTFGVYESLWMSSIVGNMWLEEVPVCSFLIPLPVHSWCRLFWHYFYLKPSQSTGQGSLVYNRHMEQIRISVFLVLFPVIWEYCDSWLFSVTALKAQQRSTILYVLSTSIPHPIRSWVLRGA